MVHNILVLCQWWDGLVISSSSYIDVFDVRPNTSTFYYLCEVSEIGQNCKCGLLNLKVKRIEINPLLEVPDCTQIHEK